MAAFLGALADLVAPPACAACGEPLPSARALCARCEIGLSECDPAECVACGLRADRSGVCRRCLDRLAPLAGVRCAFVHDGPIAEAIHAFKYRGRDDLGGRLGGLLCRALPEPVAPDVLVAPVPLHPRRLRERGFDQAWLLARALAGHRHLRAIPRLLRRVRHGRPQVGLDRQGREANVLGAFEAEPEARGRDVLLVDDVLTTGATLRAAARALALAGARQVTAVTLARALE